MEQSLEGGKKMFATLQPGQIHQATLGLSASDSKLKTLMDKYGARKFWAAVKMQGLEPQDVDAKARRDQIAVHERVPEANASMIKEKRANMWEELRQSRLRDVERALEGMSDAEVHRYWKCETGINPVDPKRDLPPVESLHGMEDFNRMQEQHHAKVKAEQTRKATNLGLDFLREKKRRDDADAAMAAFEKRMADYRKEQAEEWKNRSIALTKKAEKRKQDADRAAQTRREWEDETEANLWDRFSGARARRAHRYSPEGLSAKLEANKQKRMAAWHQACEQEEQMLNRLEERRIQCEERLEARRIEQEAKFAQQRADSQAKFQARQVMIHAKTTEWVENKLQEHAEYKDKVERTRQNFRDNMKERSKSCNDVRKKTWDKVKQNKDKLNQEKNNDNEALLEKHQMADQRREELNIMKLKNENDIYTFREMKHHSFGELARRRNEENKRRKDAQSQALVFKLAEGHARGRAQREAGDILRNARQRIAKESLTFQDNANEGFLKIQSEPDEAKVIATMNALGFDMPTLPDKDDIIEEEETKAAF